MDSSLFPFMAKAFNEIFNKIDEFSKSVQSLNTNLITNIENINNQIDTSSKQLFTNSAAFDKQVEVLITPIVLEPSSIKLK